MLFRKFGKYQDTENNFVLVQQSFGDFFHFSLIICHEHNKKLANCAFAYIKDY